MNSLIAKYAAIFILSYLIAIGDTLAQENFAISEIDGRMLKNANAVVRNFKLEFEVKSIGSATKKVHYAITILNESGKQNSTHHVFYDPDQKITSISARLFDRDGAFIKKLKQNEIRDESSVSGFSIYEDDRVKILDLSYPRYPYTVVFEYEIELDGLLFYPRWYPQKSNKIAVEFAEYTVRTIAGNDARYLSKNLNSNALIQELGSGKLYYWSVKEIQAFEREPYGPPLAELVPVVWTAPTQFEMGGYDGSMLSWNDFGKWLASLNRGLSNLPLSARQEIQELVRDVEDPIDKVRKVYEYLQTNTRYVSVQLGIGGWRPFSATYVMENGYGDCKALANYTQSLLKAVDIDSYYTLVKAGRNEPDIEYEFPSNQFNHVIVAVPMAKDTIWLECTSQTNPFGYTGSFTSDRHALLVTDEGAHVVHTPVFSSTMSRQLRTAQVSLDTSGGANAEVFTQYRGLQYENVDDQLRRSAKEKKEWLYKNLDLTGIEILSTKYELNEIGGSEINEILEIQFGSLVSKSGKRAFLVPNVFNRNKNWPRIIENRKTEVVTRFGYMDLDSIHFSLPANLHVEYMPDDVDISSPFGKYYARYQVDDNGILFVRKLRFEKGVFPPESYTELVNFLKQIVKADKMKIVLINST